MKSIYFIFLAASISFVSCKNSDEVTAKADPRLIKPFTEQAATNLQTQTTNQPAPQRHNLFHENNAVGTPSVAARINPAHGQPNHRCDIAVGAPFKFNQFGNSYKNI